ncbi:MAG: tRNA-Thr(GGU) m(6)t(6)A37 methyltransferase TsaA [Alteromonadaceae bacterium]|jgi:tRNA-Thr(GGU) m(6)t(6)A37 methyltransferase TsaA
MSSLPSPLTANSLTDKSLAEASLTEKKAVEQVSFNIIANVNSPYKEKFAIPRQPGLVSAAKGSITLLNDVNVAETVRGLEQFSHIWLLFIFHATQDQGWKPLVRPPRLGGNKKLGVLATRSTFRPNPIGMSVVKLDSISYDKNQVNLHISGLDLLDGTPIIDIKPYIPYSDNINDAQAGFAQTPPQNDLTVTFDKSAQFNLQEHQKTQPELATLITQVLAQDPRPAYKKNKEEDNNIYGIRLYDLNIKWRLISTSHIEVVDISLY